MKKAKALVIVGFAIMAMMALCHCNSNNCKDNPNCDDNLPPNTKTEKKKDSVTLAKYDETGRCKK